MSQVVASTPESAAQPRQHAVTCSDARVFFGAGSTALDADARQRLAGYAACITRRETHVLFISGKTDPSGGLEHNVPLARARGRAVASYLESMGCRTGFEIRSSPQPGSLQSRQVWPLEQSATMSVQPQH